MPIVYNADEIYEMGVEIEKNGREFYRHAAELAQDDDAKRLFLELSDWETRHIDIFEKLRQNVPDDLKQDDSGFDIDQQKHAYLKAAADSHIFSRNLDPVEFIKNAKSPADILRYAMNFEKDSVVLYVSMKNIVPAQLGRDTIDGLINEEIKHVSMLQEQIDILEGAE
ncbi:MAG: ferritin-like domain-containing protein [Chitinivibrionales bacterium]